MDEAIEICERGLDRMEEGTSDELVAEVYTSLGNLYQTKGLREKPIRLTTRPCSMTAATCFV